MLMLINVFSDFQDQKCVNPCPACGPNAGTKIPPYRDLNLSTFIVAPHKLHSFYFFLCLTECRVISHSAVCSCPPGYTGDPFYSCSRIPGTYFILT